MATSDLQGLYNRICTGETVTVQVVDRKQFESLRVSLSRKFKTHTAVLANLDSLGRYEAQFLRASWNSELVTGTFYLEHVEKKSNVPGREFKVVDL